MMPIIVRPWETGNLRKILVVPPFSNPTQYHQDRPLIWIRPFEEISGTSRNNNVSVSSSLSPSSTQPIRIRPLTEILDQDDEAEVAAEHPKIYVRSLSGMVQDTGQPITKPRKYFVRRWRMEKVMMPSKPRNFVIRNSKSSVDMMPKIVSVTSVRDEINSFRSAEPSSPSEPLNLSKTDNISQYFPREKKNEYTFEKIIIDQKPQVVEPHRSFETKYSPLTGPYYDCPHCLQKYVSPLDVTEHLVNCAKLPENEPVAPPSPAPSVQVELIDLEEEEDIEDDGDNLEKDPDFILPLSSLSVSTPTENVEKSPNNTINTEAGSNNGKFTCGFPGCKKLFATKGGLRGHNRSHKVSNNVFKCPECSSQFSWKAQLKSHLVKRHPKLASTTTAELDKYRLSAAIIANSVSAAVSAAISSSGKDEKSSGKNKKNDSYPGSTCGQQGSGGSGRRKGKNQSGVENHFCSQCNLRFSTAHEYLAHDMQHRIDIEKNFTCKICNRGFFRRVYLIEHEKSHGILS